MPDSTNLLFGRKLAIAFAAAGLLLNPWLLARIVGAAHPAAGSIALVLLFDAGLLAAGWGLWKGRIGPRHLIFIAMISFGSLLLLEGGLRIFFAVRNRLIPQDRRITAEGWATTPDEHIRRELPGFGLVEYQTGRGGFRAFGDLATTKTRLLAIGDSFTQGHTVGAGGMYAERLAAAHPEVELFAYGCAGYGTLQEQMVFDRWFDTIRPDLVLWQFTANDLFNNDREMESASLVNNNAMRRPYWVDGGIEYGFPYQRLGAVHWLTQRSTLLRLLNVQLNSLKPAGESIESSLTADDPRLRRAIATTGEILALVVSRAGRAPVAAFSADKARWAPGIFETLCRENGIVWLPGVAEAIEAARGRGEKVDGLPYDSHWNAAGHAIAAETIGRELKRAGLLKE